MAKKKKASRKNTESGIYNIWVNDKYVGRKVPGLTKNAAIERWKHENPADAAKNVTGIKVADMHLSMGQGQYAQELEQVEQRVKQATQAHIDSFPKKS